MKKWIPAVIAVVLIILIVGISGGMMLVEKYSYSKERADLKEYFSLDSEDEVAILLQDAQIEESARVWDGVYYLDLPTIHKYISERFYLDSKEGLLLYTLPLDTVRTEIGASEYHLKQGSQDTEYVIARYEGDADVLYVALDFVKKFASFRYETFTEPNRMQLYIEETTSKKASLKKKTALRYQGGIKSPILTDLAAGDSVVVLEEMETWSKVKTEDAFIGYVENKQLEISNVGTLEQEGEPIPGEFASLEYTSIVRPYKITLVWHSLGGISGGDVLEEDLAGTHGINVVSPTWFALNDNEGNFSSLANTSYVEKAHELGMEVWALIDNFIYVDDEDTYEVLSSTSKRAKLVENLMKAVSDYDLDGINIDFEGLTEDTGEHFIQFIRELSVECRARGIVLSVDNYVPTGYTEHYDRGEQGVFADYVIIMGYDEHYNGSPKAGSVASIGFVEEGIRRTLEAVPGEKVINALPFYTRVWKTQGSELSSVAVGMQEARQFVDRFGMTEYWDEEVCQNYAEGTKDGVFYQVWLEDEQSIEAKLNIMKKHEIGGVAAWRLGFEVPEIWDHIAVYTGKLSSVEY